jgi:hypothetical protein
MLGALVLKGGLGKIKRQWQSNAAWGLRVLAAGVPYVEYGSAWGVPGTGARSVLLRNRLNAITLPPYNGMGEGRLVGDLL